MVHLTEPLHSRSPFPLLPFLSPPPPSVSLPSPSFPPLSPTPSPRLIDAPPVDREALSSHLLLGCLFVRVRRGRKKEGSFAVPACGPGAPAASLVAIGGGGYWMARLTGEQLAGPSEGGSEGGREREGEGGKEGGREGRREGGRAGEGGEE